MKIFLIKTILLGSVMIGLCCAKNSENTDGRVSVAVVGAGIAGLTAAYYLEKAGVDVCVYEARNRVGGRILTAIINGSVTELGGYNIADGGEALHLRALASELEISFENEKYFLGANFFNGEKLVPFSELCRVPDVAQADLYEHLKKIASQSKSMKDVVGQLFEEGSDSYRLLRMRLMGYEGAALEDLSSNYVETLYYMLQGGVAAAHKFDEEKQSIDRVFIKTGNATLPVKIAEKLGDRVNLGCELISIDRDDTNRYVLKFKNEKVVKADYVVLAIPPSIYSKISFSEDVIPTDRLAEISSIKLGENAKIVMPFDVEKLKTDFTVNDTTLVCHAGADNLLLAYQCGEKSFFDKQSFNGFDFDGKVLLEQATQGSVVIPTRAVCAKDEQFASYEDVIVGKSWPADPYACGSYAYVSPGQENYFLTSAESFDKGLYEKFDRIAGLGDHVFAFASHGKIYFAGEHASILREVPGTMEAACESGVRIALAIQSLFDWEIRFNKSLSERRCVCLLGEAR
ncbi:FAD-dependent oxidoreductase [Candidatus Dependentiae bacterium]|nr:FAD-dependent oxidoreductase [Candidatus Dependentiae bacterium]